VIKGSPDSDYVVDFRVHKWERMMTCIVMVKDGTWIVNRLYCDATYFWHITVKIDDFLVTTKDAIYLLS
jgi:hypothetical protein